MFSQQYAEIFGNELFYNDYNYCSTFVIVKFYLWVMFYLQATRTYLTGEPLTFSTHVTCELHMSHSCSTCKSLTCNTSNCYLVVKLYRNRQTMIYVDTSYILCHVTIILFAQKFLGSAKSLLRYACGFR